MTAVFLCLSTTVRPASAVSAERAWLERAETLVAAAKAYANAAEFRRDVEAQRERLREVVRREGPQPTAERRQLHVSMILLNALLKSASDCHQGGRIVCPPELIRQLDAQIRAVRAQLNAVQG